MADNKNNKKAIAELETVSHHIPEVLRTGRNTYWSIVKFESDDNFNKGSLWHLHVTFEDNSDPSQDRFLTTVGLLSADGPEHLLYKGSRFSLIGDDLKTVKAKGVITEVIP